MSKHITRGVIERLVSEGFNVRELDHAFRIEQRIDCYKNQLRFKSLQLNKVINVLNLEDLYDALKEHLYHAPKYVKLESEYRESKTFAEDYHFGLHLDKNSDDHLYFLVHRDTVKIGRSKDVAKRLHDLKTSLSNNFLVFVIENKGCLEKIMHECFSEFRINGEWFTLNYRLDRFMLKYCIPFTSKVKNIEIKEDFKMPFGKYKGLPIVEVPKDYLIWVYGNYHDVRPNLKSYIETNILI
jgi:hypothetical protein